MKKNLLIVDVLDLNELKFKIFDIDFMSIVCADKTLLVCFFYRKQEKFFGKI